MPKKRSSSRRGYQSRRVDNREVLQRFLIVCEGEETEPNYFKGFRVPSVTIKIEGLGKDPLTLVERTIDLRSKGQFDQVWCVFDRDDVSFERFNQATNLARRQKIETAYSNQAFELWYLLHFHYCDVAQARHDYIDGLSRQLGRSYQKNDLALYTELLPRQDEAIRNAERLLALYTPVNPATDDPSTTVHRLVKELNRFVQSKRFS